jgi:hypothetical protein
MASAVFRAVRARAVRGAVGVAIVAVLGAVPAGGLALGAHPRGAREGATAKNHVVCRVPRLKGLIVRVARERADKAGCSIRTVGARVERPEIQTIRAQSPLGGQHGRVVTLWVNRLCYGSDEPEEPRLTPGQTGLVSGLLLSGGPPLKPRSEPVCTPHPAVPGAGTITVRELSTGLVVASRNVTTGHLATIPLFAGTYTIEGTFDEAHINGQLGHSRPTTVRIPSGETVRQDVWLSIK